MKHVMDTDDDGKFIVDENASTLIHHVYPLVDVMEHQMSLGHGDCWCNPVHYQLCTQCEDYDPDCWLCGGEGTIPIEFDDGVLPRIIVHNRGSGDA